MDLAAAISWGTPLGIGLFLCLLGVGMGTFFWGISQMMRYDKK